MTKTKRPRIANAGRLALMLVLVSAGWGRTEPLVLSVPNLQAAAGKEVEVPIKIKGAKGMSALQARLSYDPAVLEVIKDTDDPDQAITKGKILPDNAIFKVYTTAIPVPNGQPVQVKPGALPILFVGGANKEKKEYHAIQEDGTLATIRFRVVGQAGQKSALKLEKSQAFQSNDMEMIVKTEAGELTVQSALPWLWIAIGAGVLVLLLLLLLFRRSKPQPHSTPHAPGGYGGGACRLTSPKAAPFNIDAPSAAEK